jgi:hypothetical protein
MDGNIVDIIVRLVQDPVNQQVAMAIGKQIAAAAAGAVTATAGLQIAQRGANMLGGAIMAGAGAPTLGNVGAFQQASRFVVQSMNNVTDAALTLARTGFRVLLAEMAALVITAKKVATDFISINEKFQGLEITLRSSFKSPDIAKDIREALTRITIQSPIPFEGLSELTRALAIMPQTRGQLLNQQLQGGDMAAPGGFLRNMTTLVEKMLAFRPEKGVADAVFAIREALGGEFRSLIRRFDIPMNLVAQLSGKTVKELKVDQPATLDALQTLFNKIITDEAVRESVRQPSRQFQNIKEQVYDIPLLRLGEAGVYDKILNTLEKWKNITGELTAQKTDANGRPLQGTSLVESVAPQMATAINRMLDRLLGAGSNMLEGALSKSGFGADKGGSTIERSLNAAVAFVDKLADVLPPFIERLVSVISQLVPLLAKLSDLVLKFADQWLGWMTSNPISTILGTLLGYQALRSGPGIIAGMVGMAPNYQNMHIGGYGRGSFLPAALGGSGAAGTAGQALGATAGFLGAVTLMATTVVLGMGVGRALGLKIEEAQDDKSNKAFKQLNDVVIDLARGNNQATLNALKEVVGRRVTEQQTNAATAGASGTGIIAKTFGLDLLPDFSQSRKDLVKILGEGNAALIDSPEKLKQFKDILDNMVQYVQAGVIKVKDLTTSEVDVRSKYMDSLNAYFAKTFAQGGPLKSLEEATYTSLFKNTFGKSNVASTQLDALQTSPAFAEVGKFQDKLNVEANPLYDSMKKLSGIKATQNEVQGAIDTILSALTGSEGALKQGVESTRAVVQETVDRLERAVKEGKLNPEDKIDQNGNKIKDLIDSYKRMLDDIGDNAYALGKTFEELRSNALTQTYQAQINVKVNSAVAGVKLFTELIDDLAKGKFFSPAALEDIKASIKGMNPDFTKLIETPMKEIDKAIADPGANAVELNEAKVEGSRLKQMVDEAIATYARQVTEQVISSISGVSGVTTTTSSSGRSKITPTFIKRTGRETMEPPFPTNGANPLANPIPGLDTSGLPGYDVLPPGTGDLFDPYVEAAEKLAKKGSETVTTYNSVVEVEKDTGNKLKGLVSRKTDDVSYKKDIQNAIQEMGNILGQVDTIRNGPLRTFLENDFQKTIAQFPELRPVADKNLGALFAEVKEGDAGLDALYEKMKATSEFSKAFAEDLRRMAAASGNDPQTRDHYLDAARGYDLKAAQLDQRTHDMDKGPFTTFFEGLEKSVGTSQHALMDLSKTGQQVGDAISRDLGSAFAEFATGAKSGKEAFADFAKAIIGDLARMAAEAAAKNLMGLLVNAGSAVLGSFGGGETAWQTEFLNTGGQGYARGGFVSGGQGGIDDIHARLTAGEYVLNRRAVNHIGVHNLHRANSVGFKDGGLVGGSSEMFNPKGGGTKNYTFSTNVTVNAGKDGDNKESDLSNEDAHAMNRLIENKVKELVFDQTRPGGLLHRR